MFSIDYCSLTKEHPTPIFGVHLVKGLLRFKLDLFRLLYHFPYVHFTYLGTNSTNEYCHRITVAKLGTFGIMYPLTI